MIADGIMPSKANFYTSYVIRFVLGYHFRDLTKMVPVGIKKAHVRNGGQLTDVRRS